MSEAKRERKAGRSRRKPAAVVIVTNLDADELVELRALAGLEPEDAPRARRTTIAVVDPDARVRETARERLERAGANGFVACASAAEAVPLIRRAYPTRIALDVDLATPEGRAIGDAIDRSDDVQLVSLGYAFDGTRVRVVVADLAGTHALVEPALLLFALCAIGDANDRMH